MGCSEQSHAGADLILTNPMPGMTRAAEGVCLSAKDRYRRAKRMSTYLRNDMQGWEAVMAEQRDLASALAVVLVLLTTIQYTGMLTPPLGYISHEVDVLSNGGLPSSQTEPFVASQKKAVLAFVVCNAVGFALSTVALLAILATTMIKSQRGPVSKAVDTFCAYVTDASVTSFTSEEDYNAVSISYRRAIARNFKNTMESPTMRYRLGSLEQIKGLEGCIQYLGLQYTCTGLVLPRIPSKTQATIHQQHDAQVAAGPLIYWQLFSAVHTFFWLCLPCELEKHKKLVSFSSACLAASVVCTAAAFVFGICASSVSLESSTAWAAWVFLIIAVILSVVATCLRVKVNISQLLERDDLSKPIKLNEELRNLSHIEEQRRNSTVGSGQQQQGSTPEAAAMGQLKQDSSTCGAGGQQQRGASSSTDGSASSTTLPNPTLNSEDLSEYCVVQVTS